jgi:hypothetical protein
MIPFLTPGSHFQGSNSNDSTIRCGIGPPHPGPNQDLVDPGTDRGSEELERIEKRVGGFRWKASPAWRCLSLVFGPRLRQDELVSIAELVADRLHIRLDRDARRRKIVMVKWFEENWARVEPLLAQIVLE